MMIWQVGIEEPRGFDFVWHVLLVGDLKNIAEANLYSLSYDSVQFGSVAQSCPTL